MSDTDKIEKMSREQIIVLVNKQGNELEDLKTKMQRMQDFIDGMKSASKKSKENEDEEW